MYTAVKKILLNFGGPHGDIIDLGNEFIGVLSTLRGLQNLVFAPLGFLDFHENFMVRQVRHMDFFMDFVFAKNYFGHFVERFLHQISHLKRNPSFGQ